MDITRFAIEKDRISIAVLFVLLVLGLSAYKTMPRSEDPGYIVRTAVVTTFFPGASPERVELLITDKLERVIQQMPEVDVVYSTSRVGLSVVYVDVKENYKNMRPIWDDLRRKVEDTIPELPSDIRGPYVDDEFGDVFGTIYTITGDGFSYRELKDIAKNIQNELLLTDEVAKVEIIGAQEEWVEIQYSNARLAEFNLSPKRLARLLQDRNIILPGGDIRTQFEKIVIEPTGDFDSIEDIKNTVITIPETNELVRLQDIVEIRRTYIDPPQSLMRADGVPSLALAISLREGGNILTLGEQVDAVMNYALTTYPIGIEFGQFMFQADIVDDKIKDFLGNLYQAVAIVALVMLVFLGVRTGLIVASLIPTTMITTMFFMTFFDIGLDQVSLASLIIALGILVDNAIVMSESVIVQMQAGRKVKEAAINAAKELRIPLLTSSLTTSAAFLPIVLAESATSENVVSLFYVVTITLLTSWIMALTLIPLLCVKFLKVKKQMQTSQAFNTRAYRMYRGGLLTALRHPWVSVIVVIAIFFGALQAFKLVPNIFFPPNDRPTFTVEIELPEGSPIERTMAVTAGVDAFIQDTLLVNDERTEGVTDWTTYVGGGEPKFTLSYNPSAPDLAYALMIINATSLDAILNDLIPTVERFIIAHYPDAKPTVRPLTFGPDAWPPVAVRVSGSDTDKLFEIVDQVKAFVTSVPGTRIITDDWGPRSKNIILQIDDVRAQLANVTNEDIAISMQTHLTGLQATEYREGDELIPVMLRSAEEERLDYSRFQNMNVYSQATGRSVPLSQVANLELAWQPGKIKRRNRQRTVAVEAMVADGFTSKEVVTHIRPWMEEQAATWPFGFSWEFGGEEETSVEAQKSIIVKLPFALLIILLLMIMQFNSFKLPAIIMLTIPLALIGAVIGLLITGKPFDFMSMLGLISLAGIIINNAIVLLDRIRIEIEEEGRTPARAVIESAQQRLRPILLTTMTTVGGMIPLWLGGGLMWESMAITIIFGIIVATVLTLGVVPILYTLFFRVKFKDFVYEEATEAASSTKGA